MNTADIPLYGGCYKLMVMPPWLTLSCRRSIRAAKLARRFSSFCSIFIWSFSSAIRLKLLFSSMALNSTSRSCSRFSARTCSTCASWDWRGKRDGKQRG